MSYTSIIIYLKCKFLEHQNKCFELLFFNIHHIISPVKYNNHFSFTFLLILERLNGMALAFVSMYMLEIWQWPNLPRILYESVALALTLNIHWFLILETHLREKRRDLLEGSFSLNTWGEKPGSVVSWLVITTLYSWAYY